MNRFVLDASVALAWFLDRPMPALAARVKQSLLSGGRAIVPALWHLEIANGFAVAERRGLLEAADVGACLDEIERLLLQAIESSSLMISVRQTYNTAHIFHLSAYDAVYLDVAREERLALATLDQGLRAAASRAGVELFR
ncbi:MAG: type II toxin-antitoxin system VapC family toxin [Acidobacteria bacterium]|nr:type II toxin-antitoxin system VapC family toxin [Acidobacteriota bacterium]MBI3662441.1 type II toxin-antitoxin system VapC family toxin [Acidobacteriota bacterium]